MQRRSNRHSPQPTTLTKERPMIRLPLTLIFLAVNAFAAVAESNVPSTHSIIQVIFIVPNGEPFFKPTTVYQNAEQSMRVGNNTLPAMNVRPISISIDGDFVGHALEGYYIIEPSFSLPYGKRKFSFSCQGFKPVSKEIFSLGSGSKQFLIVEMVKEESGKTESSNPEPDQTP
ncbi:MAG: hypothetical protein AAF664_00880 [Planctomycetota bacterium]